MQRCLQLARLAAGFVAPNPMVGSVLVYQDKIIGEGYHQQYGKVHAEVNCIASVKKGDQPLLSKSVLYVSLEPCSHWGKTPPCADLIIRNKLPKVVVGCRDPFEEVNGKGIEKLKEAGIEVITGILENECKELNKRFFTFHQKRRPYIILKWAQTQNNIIANDDGSRLLITNDYTNRLVHKWRSEEPAIMVGTNTALQDNPQLNTRLWPGRNPVRIVIDHHLRLPSTLHIFDDTIPTIIFNYHQHNLSNEMADLQNSEGIHYYQITDEGNNLRQLLSALHQLNIQSVLVEGGAQVLQSFIDQGLWDEARVITNEQLIVSGGLQAPQLQNEQLQQTKTVFSDVMRFYKNKTS